VLGGLVGCQSTSRHGIPTEDLPPKVAWKVMEDDKGTAAIVGEFFTVNNKNVWAEQAGEIQTQAHQMAQTSDLPSQAFDQIVDQISQELAVKLPEFAASRKVEGKSNIKIALAVGRFAANGEAMGQDPRLQGTLSRVAARLQRNAEFNSRVHVVQFNSQDAQAVINEIGGGAGGWIEPDGGNIDSVALKEYHPDVIYILTGEMYFRETKSPYNYEKTFYSIVNVMHPRTKTSVPNMASEFKTSYCFHPYRQEWISEQTARELESQYNAAAPAKK
jgi:hypothetical protein